MQGKKWTVLAIAFMQLENIERNCGGKLDDPYLIYKVHNKSSDPSRPSFVFKTSKEQLQIAVDIDRQEAILLVRSTVIWMVITKDVLDSKP